MTANPRVQVCNPGPRSPRKSLLHCEILIVHWQPYRARTAGPFLLSKEDARPDAVSDHPEPQLWDDETLMVCLKGGEKAALVEMFRRSSRLVLSIAIRILRDMAEPEEVVQEVGLRRVVKMGRTACQSIEISVSCSLPAAHERRFWMPLTTGRRCHPSTQVREWMTSTRRPLAPSMPALPEMRSTTAWRMFFTALVTK